MKDKKKKKAGIEIDSMKIDRRKFLGKLTLVGAGVIVYSSPTVSAASKLLSGGQPVSKQDRVLDVDLPATYEVSAPSNWVNIKFENGPEAKANFMAKGKVKLHKTARPNIAEVEVIALRLTSVDPNPFNKQGLKTGKVVAAVKRNTRIGTLDLKTGKLQEKPIPIRVSLKDHKTMAKGSTVSMMSEVKQAAAQAGGDKCTKQNDIKIEGLPPIMPKGGDTVPFAKALMSRSNAMGKLLFSFKPIATPARKLRRLK